MVSRHTLYYEQDGVSFYNILGTSAFLYELSVCLAHFSFQFLETHVLRLLSLCK